jgi:predicted dehydrogenase
MGNMTDSPCKVAIIGAGNMAKEHIRAFKNVPSVRLVGIHSRTRSKAKALADEYQIDGIFDSIAELYNQTHADLVVVTVFETAMNSVSKKCFDFPWTVLLEKPPGYNLDDALDIAACAKKQKSKVFVGLNRRFLSSTRAALNDLTHNPDARYIHVQDQQDMAVASQLGHPDIVVKNWMYANSIHLVDYFSLFGRGKVTNVTPIFKWTPKTSRVVAAKIEFSSGDLGLYEGIWNGPGPWSVTITTPKKCWEMRPLEQAVYQNQGDRTLHPVDIHPWDTKFKPGFRLQAEMAVAAAQRKESDSPTLDHAMDTMKLIREIFNA